MKRPFAAKVYLTFWIIVLSAIIFATIYQALALNRDLGKIAYSLKTKLPSVILIGAIAQFFLYRICRSIKADLRSIQEGDSVPDAEVIRIQKKIKSLELVFILVNSVGFILGPSVTFVIYAFIGRTYPPFEILFIIANHLLIATAGCLLQISLTHIIFQDILRSFRVYKSIPALKSIPVMARRLFVFVILLLFPMFLLAGFVYGMASTGVLRDLPISETGRYVWEFLIHCSVYLGFMFLVFYVLSKEEQNKLKALGASLEENLTARNRQSAKISIMSHDDYAHLASAINEYTGRLEHLVMNISSAGKTVGETTKNLQESISQSEHSLDNLKIINHGISSVVAQETQAVSEASKAVEAFSDSVERVDFAVLQQSSFVEESSASITQMNANIESVVGMAVMAAEETENLSGTIKDGSARLSESQASMQKLKEASANVQTVVGVIQTIASQINLLAMNAAIEAAHAGDSGRGFAVVAQEVRKLAEQSSKSVKEIRFMIKDMIGAIETGVASSQQTEEAFSRITEAVQNTSRVISSVSAAMEEQKAGAGEIKASMEALVRATEAIQAEVKQQSETNKEMNTAFQSLFTAVSHLEEKTREQQQEDGHLVHVIEDLHVVNRQNSEAVTNLVSAVDF